LEINVDLTPFIVSPLRLYPLGLEINVDLTPFIKSTCTNDQFGWLRG
jgi:hypothetical protein